MVCKGNAGPTVEYREPELTEVGHPCPEVVRGLPFGKPIPLPAAAGRQLSNVDERLRRHSRAALTRSITDPGARHR